MRTLITNTILGVVLLFLTNLVLADDIPINLLTVIICAIGGVIGWLVILILHLSGVAIDSKRSRGARNSGTCSTLNKRGRLRVDFRQCRMLEGRFPRRPLPDH
jgi:uncharacterized membrane protein YhaH (DUF805 family)